MSVLALGINHKSASVAVREKLAFAADGIKDALLGLKQSASIHEAAILSTCNRVELYATGPQHNTDQIVHWLGDYHQLAKTDIESCLYAHSGEAAVRHMMRVASGLDSMVLGEPQILGQMKQAFSFANEAGTMGVRLERLFHQTFSVAKLVRSDTAIGSHPVSVAYASITLAKRIFSSLADKNVLFIGAGETIELAARHLAQQNCTHFVFANRSTQRAENLAKLYDGNAIALSEIADVLPEADIVIASTGSSIPILGKGTVEHAIKVRKHKPIFMVDLAVPRDIEEQVNELDDVYLYTVDDLENIVQDNMEARQEAASEAEDIIDIHSHRFMRWLRSLESVDLIRDFRNKQKFIRDKELQRALKNLQAGNDPQQILQELANRLCNKYSHAPTEKLRQFSGDGDQDALALSRRLLDLDD